MAAVAGDDVVVLGEDGHDAGRDGFLPAVEVEEAGHPSLEELLVGVSSKVRIRTMVR